jgi:hypothetical protein
MLAVGALALANVSPPNQGAELETFKIVLQTILVTGGGGILVLLLGNLRDEATRRQERASAIQSLDRNLDATYRSLKKIKRSLRAHRTACPHDTSVGPTSSPASSYRIARTIFHNAMRDLLDAQVELESVCEHIRQRTDLLEADRLDRMKLSLDYISRYYHDVHEDFEKHRLDREPKAYILKPGSHILNWLRTREEEKPKRPVLVESLLDLVEGKGGARESDRGISENDMRSRTRALAGLIKASPLDKKCTKDPPGGNLQELSRTDWSSLSREATKDKVRYPDVAGACFDLLSAELTRARIRTLGVAPRNAFVGSSRRNTSHESLASCSGRPAADRGSAGSRENDCSTETGAPLRETTSSRSEDHR